MDKNKDIELHEEAGLLCQGQDEDEILQYLGTKKQWDTYYLLLEQEENI